MVGLHYKDNLNITLLVGVCVVLKVVFAVGVVDTWLPGAADAGDTKLEEKCNTSILASSKKLMIFL